MLYDFRLNEGAFVGIQGIRKKELMYIASTVYI
jgi:hypothetical protein